MKRILLILAIAILIAGCAQKEPIKTGDSMKITSSAFKNEGIIPSKYTCDGKDISPDLKISGIPKGAKTLALICDDPDAPVGTFVHWVAWNIPPGNISEGEDRFDQGTNDANKVGYKGPCPPAGKHRYFFKLYALDIKLELPEGTTKTELVDAMEGHILGQGELVGTYARGE